jgi:hypothetical protein
VQPNTITSAPRSIAPRLRGDTYAVISEPAGATEVAAAFTARAVKQASGSGTLDGPLAAMVHATDVR